MLPPKVVLPAWLTVKIELPVVALLVIVPAAPDKEERALLPPVVSWQALRSTRPALAVRPPVPRAKGLLNCSVPPLTVVPPE